MNLHQFLDAEAGRRAARQALRFEPARLPQGEWAAWEQALTRYGPISKRDHVRDMGLIVVNDTLSQVEGDTLPSTIEPAIAAALTRAAPVYRARLWPEHRRANEAWPSQPILVDVSHSAGRFGAYTTLQFGRAFAGHTTVSSFDEGSDGATARAKAFALRPFTSAVLAQTSTSSAGTTAPAPANPTPGPRLARPAARRAPAARSAAADRSAARGSV